MAQPKKAGPEVATSIGTPPPSCPEPKKTRKNPARRKAERAKSYLDQPKEPSSTTGKANGSPPKLARQQSAPSGLAGNNVNKPALPNNKPTLTSTASATATPNLSEQTRPKPTRSATTPQSTASPPQTLTIGPPRLNRQSSSLAFNAPAIVTGGLIGCAAGAAILMAVSVWYDFAGVKAAVATARAARLCVDNLSEEIITSLNAGTYSTDEALDVLRRTTLAYASTIPDGAPVVERIFREIGAVRQSRGAEVDRVLAAAYDEMHRAGDKGVSAIEMRRIIFKHLAKLSWSASKATQDVLTRNPGLKTYRDGAIKALQEPPRGKVPTTKVNLVVKHKEAVTAR